MLKGEYYDKAYRSSVHLSVFHLETVALAEMGTLLKDIYDNLLSLFDIKGVDTSEVEAFKTYFDKCMTNGGDNNSMFNRLFEKKFWRNEGYTYPAMYLNVNKHEGYYSTLRNYSNDMDTDKVKELRDTSKEAFNLVSAFIFLVSDLSTSVEKEFDGVTHFKYVRYSMQVATSIDNIADLKLNETGRITLKRMVYGYMGALLDTINSLDEKSKSAFKHVLISIDKNCPDVKTFIKKDISTFDENLVQDLEAIKEAELDLRKSLIISQVLGAYTVLKSSREDYGLYWILKMLLFNYAVPILEMLTMTNYESIHMNKNVSDSAILFQFMLLEVLEELEGVE